jgi:hypothetical protein
MVSAAGIWWVIGTRFGQTQFDLALAVSWLGAVAGLGVVVGAGFALWLDHGIVTRTRGLVRALALREVAYLRGRRVVSGWGELSQLSHQVQRFVDQHRIAERAVEDLGQLRDQIGVLRESLERWNESERWSDLRDQGGPVGPLVEVLNRGLRRLEDVREQNIEAARQIAKELGRALDAARESSEQAERGFLESTALLASVRELRRLEAELRQALAADAAGANARSWPEVGAAARDAIEDLVTGSTQAVDRLGRGLVRVAEIADQVSLLANRATLVALESTTAGRTGDETDQTRQLVKEIRATLERTTGLARELEADVAGAGQQMRDVRARVAEKLAQVPAERPPAPPRPPLETERLLGRVGELIADATHRAERLSAAGEHASRAAESVLRTLESENREMEGLRVRLSPVTTEAAKSPPPDDEPSTPPASPPGLRLLSRDDLLPDAPELSDPGAAPGTGGEPR